MTLSIRERREETCRADCESAYWTKQRDDELAENTYQFALELHALIAKHGLSDKAPLILEGACEALVDDFSDYIPCYAAFEDAEADFGGDDEKEAA